MNSFAIEYMRVAVPVASAVFSRYDFPMSKSVDLPFAFVHIAGIACSCDLLQVYAIVCHIANHDALIAEDCPEVRS